MGEGEGAVEEEEIVEFVLWGDGDGGVAWRKKVWG